ASPRRRRRRRRGGSARRLPRAPRRGRQPWQGAGQAATAGRGRNSSRLFYTIRPVNATGVVPAPRQMLDSARASQWHGACSLFQYPTGKGFAMNNYRMTLLAALLFASAASAQVGVGVGVGVGAGVDVNAGANANANVNANAKAKARADVEADNFRREQRDLRANTRSQTKATVQDSQRLSPAGAGISGSAASSTEGSVIRR